MLKSEIKFYKVLIFKAIPLSLFLLMGAFALQDLLANRFELSVDMNVLATVYGFVMWRGLLPHMRAVQEEKNGKNPNDTSG